MASWRYLQILKETVLACILCKPCIPTFNFQPSTFNLQLYCMQSKAKTVDAYIEELPEDRKAAMIKLRKVINKNIPKGFKECMSYGMIGWVVPHELYPPGYHCDPKLPLGMMNVASQKNFYALYHLGMYANKKLLDWYTSEYAKLFPDKKLDMGKGCTRFKKPEQIPFELIGQLASKLTVQQYIDTYEKMYKAARVAKKKGAK